MKIRVLGEDISKARIMVDSGATRSENCPVAQVLRRMFVGYYSGVGTVTWSVQTLNQFPGMQIGSICNRGIELIRGFDRGYTVDPCEVELYGLENVCSPSPIVVEDAPSTEMVEALSLTS